METEFQDNTTFTSQVTGCQSQENYAVIINAMQALIVHVFTGVRLYITEHKQYKVYILLQLIKLISIQH